MGGMTFTAGEETATIDLTGATVTLANGETGSLSGLAVGDVLTVQVGDGNTVDTVAIADLSSGFDGGPVEGEQGTQANENTQSGTAAS